MKDFTLHALNTQPRDKNTPGDSPVVYIYYSVLDKRLTETSFRYLMQQFPSDIQNKIRRFHRWEDQHRSLLGKLLLKGGLNRIGLNYSLTDLKYTEFSRPYFDKQIDFNISHSGQYTVCAISKIRVGIDIEEILPIPLVNFDSLFSPQEWKYIQQAKNSLQAFYTLWTQKESFVKAVGTGLHLPLNEVVVRHNKIYRNNEVWHTHEINLDQRHISYLSVLSATPELQLQRLYFS